MRSSSYHLCLALSLNTLLATTLSADNWPQFRGPNMTGTTSETGLPLKWSVTENVAWKSALPGRGWSCPIVWGDKIFVTAAVSKSDFEIPKKGLYFGGERTKPHDDVLTWKVICLDLKTGKTLWDSTAKQAKPKTPIHIKNSYASETAATDGKHVYAFFGSAGLYCFDMDGKLIWEKDLGDLPTRFGWGTASSPIVDNKHVYVQCDNEGQSFVAALDKLTGDEVWRKEREEGSSWATPFLWRNQKRTELITCATGKVRSYVPQTGELLWELGGNSVISVPTPIATSEILYPSSGYVLDVRKPVFAIQAGASGDLTDVEPGDDSPMKWVQRRAGSYNPSPILVDGYIYVLYDRGFLACLDATTGEKKYQKRISGGGPGFTASPWSYDGHLFCANEDGTTFVIKTGPEYKMVGKNELDDLIMATPAISQKRLLLRTDKHLYCFRKDSN